MKPIHASILCLMLLAGCASNSAVTEYPSSTGEPIVLSPDGTIRVTASADGQLSYTVQVDGAPIVSESKLGMKVNDANLGQAVKLVRIERSTNDSTWHNPLGKNSSVRDHFNEMRLMLEDSGTPFELHVRAYDDGVAIRYVLVESPEASIVHEDQTQFAFASDSLCFAGQDDGGGFNSSQEWNFKRKQLSELPTDRVIGLPLLVQTPAAWVAVCESDLRDWAGMWLQRDASSTATVNAKLAPRLQGDGAVKIGAAVHNSPWRVLMIGREPGDLIESNLVLNLAPPAVIDKSWIKPGMMAWDRWWSNIGAVSTESFKDFIQFAAEMDWEYQLIDAGWYVREPGRGDNNRKGDITQVVPQVDMPELLRFAKEKNVRLWLWCHWQDVDRMYEQAFPLFEQWGIAGVKIDYMDRDDQEMVNYYEKISAAAAKHHLLVNFHGAYKPTGLERTYPNQITREGVLGNEYNKWQSGPREARENRVSPEHRVTLPFTRYLLGPGDFTPGGFVNRQPSAFRANARPTQVQGTRANELALFVAYDSPVCCVTDHPDNLSGKPGIDFLKIVPTVWDETRALDGFPGEHLTIAKRSGDNWFLGAMTNSQPRDIEFKLDFLGEGSYQMKIWKDAPDADVNAENLVIEERTVRAGDTIPIHLAPSGGCVAFIGPLH